MNPRYAPNWDDLYFDSMYRSSLELLGQSDAWTISKDKGRQKLQQLVKARGFEALLPVVKWNFARYSSLMLYMRPDDWLSQFLIQTGWFKAYPILEFHHPNNDFQVNATADWICRLVTMSERSTQSCEEMLVF